MSKPLRVAMKHQGTQVSYVPLAALRANIEALPEGVRLTVKTFVERRTREDELQEIAEDVRALHRHRARAWDAFSRFTSSDNNEEFMYNPEDLEDPHNSPEEVDWAVDKDILRADMVACLRCVAQAEEDLEHMYGNYNAHHTRWWFGGPVPVVRGGVPSEEECSRSSKKEFQALAWTNISPTVVDEDSWAWYLLEGDLQAPEALAMWCVRTCLDKIAGEAYDSVFIA